MIKEWMILLIIVLLVRPLTVIVKNWKAKKQSQNDSDNREVSDEQTTQREIVYEPLNDSEVIDGELNDSEVIDGELNDHEYVDLGLPSGLKWATCNVGASAPEEYGDYYAWGETAPKDDYRRLTYKWATATYDAEHEGWNLETLTKYNTRSSYGTVDNKTVLEPEDDAAAVNWGGQWRMPTDAEWTELRENCEWTWTRNYNGTGVAGRIVTSKINGNSIFLPAAGHRNMNLIGARYDGDYWSSSLYADEPSVAWCVFFESDGVGRDVSGRYNGRSVRPVLYMP